MVLMCLDSGTFNQQRGDGRLGRRGAQTGRAGDKKGEKVGERREGGIDIDQLSKYLMRPVKSCFRDLISKKAIFFFLAK